eukprot:6960580-Prorocentrum_lima.AAC.1
MAHLGETTDEEMNIITALCSATLLEEIQITGGNYHQLDQEVICQALKSLHAKEKKGLMHLQC